MKHLGLLMGMYAAAVLETDPASWTSQTGVAICPLYLLACLAAWTNAPLRAAVWGAVIGLVADALTTGPLGIETVLVATLGWWAAHLRCRHEWRSLLAFCLLSLTLVGGLSLGSRLLRAGLIESGIGFANLLLSCAGAAFATALCGLLLLTAGRTLNRATQSFAAKSY